MKFFFSNFSIGNGTVGFSDGNAGCDYTSTNSYVIASDDYYYWLSGMPHKWECPIRAIDLRSVVGCGLLLNSKNELAVFFTVNGILCGKLLGCLYGE
jgi:hypothetical protein